MSLFNWIHLREIGISVVIGDDATYPMRGIGSICFQIHFNDVLGLSDILFIHALKKNLLLVSYLPKV
jgi:hypothetical protein